jgi:hypothetical protein
MENGRRMTDGSDIDRWKNSGLSVSFRHEQ